MSTKGWAPDPDAVVAEMQEEIDELKAAYKETFEVLWRTSKELVAANENLTATQNRCSALLLENRELKKLAAR